MSIAWRKRSISTVLWRRGGLVAAAFLTFFVGNFFVAPAKAVTGDMLGHDFLALYYGGYCARTGHFEQLYDLPATRAFEFATGHSANLSLGTSFGPWWNPPFAAWMFAPFSALPYLSALHAWWICSAICLGISIGLMCVMIPAGWKIRSLVPLLILTSKPCFLAICHGQNTFVSLLFLTMTVWLWRGGRPLLAGVVCGLLFYKPQLGAVVAAVLCLSQGRRAILGIALTGTALLLVNILTMPGSLHEFVHHVPLNLTWIQDQSVYRWERHVTLKAFWRGLVQGDTIGTTSPTTRILWALSEIALLAGLGRAMLATIRSGGPSSRDRLIAATIVAMPLLMPFYFDYDLLLVSVGIVVYAADRQNNAAETKSDIQLLRFWTVIFLSMWLWFLVLIVWKTTFNPTVPLLAVAAIIQIRCALQTPIRQPIAEPVQIPPTALAA